MNCGAKRRMVPVADTPVYIGRGIRESERGGENMVSLRDISARGVEIFISHGGISVRDT